MPILSILVDWLVKLKVFDAFELQTNYNGKKPKLYFFSQEIILNEIKDSSLTLALKSFQNHFPWLICN